jgi:hypothetical protein
MKKTLLLTTLVIVLLSVSSLTYAQFQKGDVMLNGNFSFGASNAANSDTSQNSNSSSPVNFVFSPSVAKFTSASTLNGIGLNYSVSASTMNNQISFLPPSSEKYTNQSIGVSFYTRRYFTLSKNFYFFINALIMPSYTFNKTTNTDSTVITGIDKTQGFSVSANLSTGITYRLNQRWLINASLPTIVSIAYQHSVEKNYGVTDVASSTETTSGFSLSSGLSGSSLGSIGIGFSFLLHK